MKRILRAGVLLSATVMILAACSDSSIDADETTPPAETTTPEELEVPTEEPTEDQSNDPSEEPTDGTGDPTEDPTDPAEQTATPEILEGGGDLMAQGDGPATVTWLVPGETLHIYVNGSSTPGCYPSPTEAWTDGESLEITFTPAEPGRICTQDLASHGWEVTWDSPFEVTEPMPMILNDIPQLGRTYESELPIEQTAGEATH
ncbi:hypothetical protein [Flaviflexus massiliensis]|uniref:hypothetical protein n=1 Tax=Flaviflexus massiliensis TaxID=1522309 RepID=UPI000ABE3105|nr:hypothetical protein [Flaviflexus massiliensis]